MSDDSTIRDTAEAIKGVVEAVPIYQDAVQPAAKEVGTALQTVAKTLHILLAPVSGLVWGYEKIKDHVSTKVSKKLESVPPERLKSPEPNVAGPALEALRYTGYQESLRDLYTNLLATSIDSATAHEAHPAFVEIIKQMSPDEALIMRSLAASPFKPMLDVRREEKASQTGNWVLKNFSLLPKEAGVKCPDLGPSYMINLQRLGLVELRENYTLKRGTEDLYQPLREAPEVQVAVAEINALDGHKAAINPGAIIATDLGRQFFRACIYDGTHSAKG
jgi:Abortive infection alpha